MKSTEYKEAMLATENNQIHKWVISFLRASGNNKGLSNKLEQDGQYHYGPIEYPIEKLVNIIGSDDTFKYFEDEDILNERVAKLVAAIQSGWHAPPLIATNLWEDYFELADGGHRYRAFEKLGITKYPTIFYFRDKASKNKFIEELERF